MIILPKIQIKRGEAPGNQVLVQFPNLSENEKTFLSADEASGQTTLSVISGINFVANEYVIIGTPGQEHAEIRQISSKTASTIVVSSSTNFAHPRGTQITFIPFNQIVIENDTDSAFGSATTTTIDIRADSLQTFYEDIDGTASDYYRAKFKHEQGTRYSSYSDSVIATGYADNSVYSIKKRALQNIGHKVGDFDWLTDDWLNNVLWEGRRELESNLDHWSFRKKFDTDIGNVVQGENIISAPSDLRENTTAKNLLAIYIGKNRIPLQRISKQEMNEWYRDIAHTTLDGTVATSDTTITLTDSRDFDDSGAIDIGGSNGIDNVDYTTNTISTGVLGGVTNISDSHSDLDDVWQDTSFGLPEYFTVTDDGILFNQPFNDDYHNENIYADYWGTFTALDSDADTLDEPDFDAFTNFLAFRIKKRKNQGEINLQDNDYQQWLLRNQKLVARERSEQSVYMKPDISHLDTV